MSRDKFSKIHASVIFQAQQVISQKEHNRDPLWHLQELLALIAQNCANLAVPSRVSVPYGSTLEDVGTIEIIS